jgi:hypothetical protein
MMAIIIDSKEFEKYIHNMTKNINVSQIETKIYIDGIFHDFLSCNKAPSREENITLKYIKACSEFNFKEFRDIADWIFFIRTSYPEALKTSPKYYDSIAKSSYNKCHVILNKKWLCFEEMCDRFEYFVTTIRNAKDRV